MNDPENQEEKKIDGNSLISKVNKFYTDLKKGKSLPFQKKRLLRSHTTIHHTVVDMLKRAKIFYSDKGNLLVLDKAQLDLVCLEIEEQGEGKYFAAWLQE